jgi:hypothetical protein
MYIDIYIHTYVYIHTHIWRTEWIVRQYESVIEKQFVVVFAAADAASQCLFKDICNTCT